MKTVGLALAVVLCVGMARAEDSKITIMSTGSAKSVAKSLQVTLKIKGKGPDAKEAVATLKAARDKAVAKLEELGGVAEPKLEQPPSPVEKQNDQRRQMMAARSGGRLKKKTTKEVEKTEVEMQQSVVVRIPLKGADAAAVAVEFEELKAKVTAAKPIEEPKEEGAEGDEEEAMEMYNQGQNAQGPITFAYFAPLTEELQEQALAEALKSARKSAERIAKVMGKAGVELDSVGLQADTAMQQAMYENYDRWGRPTGGPVATDGIVSPSPTISVSTTVNAGFRLK